MNLKNKKGRIYKRVWREEKEGGNNIYQNKQAGPWWRMPLIPAL